MLIIFSIVLMCIGRSSCLSVFPFYSSFSFAVSELQHTQGDAIIWVRCLMQMQLTVLHLHFGFQVSSIFFFFFPYQYDGGGMDMLVEPSWICDFRGDMLI